MKKYNNEDIVLDAMAARSFIFDLFCMGKNKDDKTEIDSITFSREENENGVVYHFPYIEINIGDE